MRAPPQPLRAPARSRLLPSPLLPAQWLPSLLLLFAALFLAAACADGDDPAAAAAATTGDADAAAVADGASAPEGEADDPEVLLRAWALITDQRRDVLDLSVEQARDLMTGAVADWAELGGAPLAVRPYLAAPERAAVERMLDGAVLAPAVETLPDTAAVLERVAAEPGAVALVPAAALRPGVLALIVGGYDPYRDPAGDSPLRLGSPAGAAPDLGPFDVAEPFDADWDPVQVIATGELIPARCTNRALEEAGDHGAAFDSTRDYLRDGELAVTALEVALTDLAPPTPCVETFVLQGDPRFVEAMRGAGLDVALTIGNHMLDCWGGACSPGAVLDDTLRRLREAGIAPVGAGPDLAAARTPHVATVGGVRFAFLGYDSIAPWNHAGPASPGVAPMEADAIAADVRAARELADHVIVGMNWGTEYTADPTPFQREQAANVFAAGATLILGNHPHWVQAIELVPGAEGGTDRLATYALGNFVFDQDWSVETQQSVVLEASFTAERLLGYRLRPAVLRGDPEVRRGLFRPELVDPAGEGRPIMDRIWGASAPLLP